MLVLTKLNRYNIKKTNSNTCTYINQLLNGIIQQRKYINKEIYLIRKNKAIYFISLYCDFNELQFAINIAGYHSFKKIYDSDDFFESKSRKLWKLINIMMDQINYYTYDDVEHRSQFITINCMQKIDYNILKFDFFTNIYRY